MNETICIIGTGRVGETLRRELSSSFSVNAISREEFLSGAIPEAQVYCITTPDSVIRNVGETLWAAGINKDVVIIHFSGVHSSSILSDIGFINAASFHPARSFQREKGTFKGCVVTVEGSDEGVRMALKLSRALQTTPVVTEGKQKALYHAATVFSSNFVSALLSVTQDLLVQSGFPQKDALEVAQDLASSSLENIRNNGLKEGLTGPVARGDAATIERHKVALCENPELLGLYTSLTERLKKIIHS